MTGATTRTSRAGTDAEARPVVEANVLELLRRYRAALELAADPRPSRDAQNKPIPMGKRVLNSLRPTWGLHRLVVEHVRARAALIDRHFARRLALGENEPDDQADREALSHFVESLPPPRSRFWTLVPLLAVAAATQILLALLKLGKLEFGASFESAVKQLVAAAELNAGSLLKTIDIVLYSSPRITVLACVVVALSVYIVWRPLLPSFRLKRIILGMPGAITARTERSEPGARASGLGVHAAELALFEALEMRPPRESALDLWIKAVPAGVLAVLAVVMLVPPKPAIFFGVVLLLLGVPRLVWLLREARRRAPRTGSQEGPRG